MAGRVGFVPHTASVRALRRLRAASSLPRGARVRVVETTTYRRRRPAGRVEVVEDSDFHLVIADPGTGGTMIVEFPAQYCTLTTKPVLRRRMRAARLAFIRACGFPPAGDFGGCRAPRRLPVLASLTTGMDRPASPRTPSSSTP
jgi:hypothetical protein